MRELLGVDAMIGEMLPDLRRLSLGPIVTLDDGAIFVIEGGAGRPLGLLDEVSRVGLEIRGHELLEARIFLQLSSSWGANDNPRSLLLSVREPCHAHQDDGQKEHRSVNHQFQTETEIEPPTSFFLRFIFFERRIFCWNGFFETVWRSPR